MVEACIAAFSIMTLIIMSLRANRKFAHEQRLPMQWSFSGAVNWTAPRLVALALMPMAAAIILAVATIGTIIATPRPGQEGFELPVIVAMSLGFVGVHALHLWLVGRYLRSRRH